MYQECVQDGMLVYTKSYINVSSIYKGAVGRIISILQVGGQVGQYSVFPFEESPLLEMGEFYYLFLKGNDYYYIAGAGQGVFSCDQSSPASLSICETMFAQESCTPFIVGTPTNVFEYPSSTGSVSFCVNSNNNVSSSVLASIKSGCTQWNGVSSLSLSESSPAYASIIINITTAPSYNVGLVGVTIKDGYYRYIDLYYDCMNSLGYLNNTSMWSRLSCHEMGHALGLGHNTLSYSVMTHYIESMAPYPQYCDEITLQELYPW